MSIYGEDLIRSGVTRKTQETNVLLVHSELGKVKPRIFAKSPPEDFAFGVSKARDAEGAREVSMKWVEHKANPDDVPGPDFKAMNKIAATNEVVTAKEVSDFRKDNMVTLKGGDIGKLNRKVVLPSIRIPTTSMVVRALSVPWRRRGTLVMLRTSRPSCRGVSCRTG